MITSLALFMVVLDNLVVSTALPVIRTDLGASLEELEDGQRVHADLAVFPLTGAPSATASVAGGRLAGRRSSPPPRPPPRWLRAWTR